MQVTDMVDGKELGLLGSKNIGGRCSFEDCNSSRYAINRIGSSGLKYLHTVCKDHYRLRFRKHLEHRYISNGYVKVRHPITGKIVSEHTIIMEEKLGREMVKGESVHHINGDKQDNSLDNLELWVGTIRYGQRARDVTCPHCYKKYSDS